MFSYTFPPGNMEQNETFFELKLLRYKEEKM